MKLDSKRRAYKVGSDGRKLMPSKRPTRYITPEEWKKMSLKEREASTKAADDIAREEVEEEDRIAKKKSKKEKKDKKDKKKKKPDEEDTKELEDMFDALADSEAEARASGSKDKDKAAPSHSLTDDDISTDGDTYPYDSDAYPDEWLEWEEFVSQQEGPGASETKSNEHVYEALVCTTESVNIATPSKRVRKEKIVAPSMPYVPTDDLKERRVKSVNRQLPFPAAVSRPVSRKEMLVNPDALKKMRDEWNGLTEQGSFEFGTEKNPLIFEYDSIRSEARTNKEEVHFGRVHGIMVEKTLAVTQRRSQKKVQRQSRIIGKQGNQSEHRSCYREFTSNI